MKWHRFLFIVFYLCNIIEKLRTTRFGASFLWTFILSSALKHFQGPPEKFKHFQGTPVRKIQGLSKASLKSQGLFKNFPLKIQGLSRTSGKIQEFTEKFKHFQGPWEVRNPDYRKINQIKHVIIQIGKTAKAEKNSVDQ